jgi:hypothetical protein
LHSAENENNSRQTKAMEAKQTEMKLFAPLVLPWLLSLPQPARQQSSAPW